MRGIERTYYNANLTAGKQAFSILEDVDFQNAYSCVILAVSTGKELDQETGYSYFGARYLDHTLTTAWLSVDPMADNYPSISPYAYCVWNPVKLVDPDGRDVWEINKSGELIWKERSATDKIISSDGSFVNVKNGVLRRGTDNTPGLSYTKEELGHFRLEFGDDSKIATEVFEFLADNANVEFSLIGLANDPSDENANRFILTTSFENDGDSYGSILACSAYKYVPSRVNKKGGQYVFAQ